jgi:hypothetical protein
MPQRHLHSTGFLRSISDTFGEAQIVAVPSRIIIDIETKNYDTAGFLHKDHALASLSVDAAAELRDALTAAIAAAANAIPAHPGIWSDATNRPVRRVGRGAA